MIYQNIPVWLLRRSCHDAGVMSTYWKLRYARTSVNARYYLYYCSVQYAHCRDVIDLCDNVTVMFSCVSQLCSARHFLVVRHLSDNWSDARLELWKKENSLFCLNLLT